MNYTRRDELNLISAKQQAVYGKQYVDEYGVVYIGNKKGRLERREGTSTAYVDETASNLVNYVNANAGTGTGTGTTVVTDSFNPFLLMGG